jgi:hypothetical protein
MCPDLQQEALGQIYNHLANGYAAQDYVREVRVHPDDVEFVSHWLAEMPMPEVVRQLVSVVPNNGSTAVPGVLIQSQVETEWLARHFEDAGLTEWIRAKGAPIMLTHKDLKMLFLLQGVDQCQQRKPHIIIPH